MNAKGGIELSDNVSISPGAKLISTALNTAIFKKEKVHVSKKIKIGNNVQIASGAIVLSGINIGNNVIVGAGSVVTKNIGDNCIVAGNPAKLLRTL